MLDAMEEYWEKEGDCDRLHMERFQPKVGFSEEGEGGEIKFLASDTTTEADGGTPILVAGEEAGLDLALRMPRGHLPHLHRQAVLGPGARPAQWKCLRHRGGDDPRVHQRAGGPRRGRPLITRSRTVD